MFCTEAFNTHGFMRIIHGIPLACYVLLLTGCSTSPEQQTVAAPPTASEQSLAEDETQRYREAITYLNENRLDRAEELLTSIIARRPEFAGPWVNMALVQIKNNQPDKAEQTLQKALERNPNIPQAYNLLGYIEKKRGNINKAKDQFLRAIARKPDYAIAHYNIALLYDIYLQDIPSAIQHYKKYLELTGNNDKDTINWVKKLERSLTREAS
jgi:tetratricopeptide (TPR) repeat protein